MKTITRTAIAFGFAAMLPISQTAAQTQIAMSTPTLASSVRSDPGLIATRWENAEQLRFEGRFTEALEEYKEIAQLQIDSFENPARTYWVMAEIHSTLGNQLEMVRAMDRVLTHARRFGDNELRARALVESTAGYIRLRNHGTAKIRMAELQGLLETETISQELRDHIDRRIHG